MRWKITKRRRRRSSVTKHYLEHKELARELVHQKLAYWNQFYGYAFNRVAIRNTRSCWGSCTSLKNLNFSYQVLFLPAHLQDYIIVHELCHLKELHHGDSFWELLAEQIPDYDVRIQALKQYERKQLPTMRRGIYYTYR